MGTGITGVVVRGTTRGVRCPIEVLYGASASTSGDSVGVSVGVSVGASGNSDVGLVASGVIGVSVGCAEGDGDGVRMPVRLNPSFLWESDQKRIAPIVVKATKIPINSSNPKGSL
jgi:hypothetical protein